MTQLAIRFPPAPLPERKGPGARRAEKLGHVLRWAWHENAPMHETWDCINCDMFASDRVPPGPGWDGTAGEATLKRCPASTDTGSMP